MHVMQLSSVDLNLLVVLDAVLAEGSVKQAARRVNLSPSATSHALGRLRELFDDPLLVRAGRRLVPTARGEALRGPVRAMLQAAEGLFQPVGPVRPATVRRAVRLVTTDYLELVLVAPLSAALAAEAPGIELHTRRARASLAGWLREGRADLAMGVVGELAADLHREPLFTERFVCLVRQDHPVVLGGLDLDTFCALDHVLVAPGGGTSGVVDQLLAAQGRSRRVVRTVPEFLVAPQLVQGTDYVLTIAERLARAVADRLGLAVVPPPLELPRFTLSMVWHERWEADPVHAWLRGRVRELAERAPAQW